MCDGKIPIFHQQGPIWSQNNTVVPEQDYYFSFYVNNLVNPNNPNFSTYQLPTIYVEFNGIMFLFDYELNGNPITQSQVIIPRNPDIWVQICGVWQAPVGTTDVDFEIFTEPKTPIVGNDVGIDEIVFATIDLPIIEIIDIDDETCFGASNGSIELTVITGGTPPYNYIWSNSSTDNLVIGLISGNYTVTVTDDNGCFATESAFVDATNTLNWPYHPDNPIGLYREQGTDVAVDDDGNVYAIGSFTEQITFINTFTSSNSSLDIYIVKFDQCGNVIWDKHIGGDGDNAARSIIVDNNGDIIITGYFSNDVDFGYGNRSSLGEWDLFVVKYTSNGAHVWDYTYDENGYYDQGHDVTVDANNHVYVVGTVYDNDFDIFLAKLNAASGNEEWRTTYDYGTYDYGHGIAYSDNLDQIIITGQIDNAKTYIGKYNPANGNAIVPPATYTNSNYITSGRRIITYYDGNDNIAFIAGSIDFQQGNNKDILLLPANIDGTTISYQTYVTINNATGVDFATDLVYDPDGFIFVTGQFTSNTLNFNVNPPCCTNTGNYDNFVAKYDIDQQVFTWAFSSSGGDTETSHGIDMNNVGFGYVTGAFFDVATFGATTLTSQGSSDAFIARLQDLITYGQYARLPAPATLTLADKPVENEMLLYPSPAYNHLNIAVKLKEASPAIIEMYDIYGNKIKTIANTNIEEAVFTVNLSHLAKGAYIARLTSKGFTTSQRFLKIVSMKKHIITFLTCFFLFGHVNSQVNVQDSLILVNIYYALDGPNWQPHLQQNWLTGPVKTWQGVGLTSDSTRVKTLHKGGPSASGYIHPSVGDLSELEVLRITSSNLAGSTIPYTIGRLSKLRSLLLWNNQLEGQIPDSICNLTSLVSVGFYQNNLSGAIPPCMATFPDLIALTLQYNQFEGLPDLSQAVPGFLLTIQYNRFTFEDIEPNWVRYWNNAVHTYIGVAPQFDSVNASIDTTVQDNSVFEMRCSIGGQYNVYQWTKDGVDIPFATDSIYIINNVELSDSGVYACRITNTLVTTLTYYRRPITLRVDKTTGNGNIHESELVRIWPNPATNLITIESPVSNGVLSISNLLGQQVLRQEVMEKHFNVDVSGLGRGVYFVRLEGRDGFMVKRFLKE